jgi:hypothetical protein
LGDSTTPSIEENSPAVTLRIDAPFVVRRPGRHGSSAITLAQAAPPCPR